MPSYLTWLADVLRSGGLPVREISGWRTRGHGPMKDVRGVLLHHTAGPKAGDFPSERVVVGGRPGLTGPLANLGLTRAGVWVVVAAGQAWHAGEGSHLGIGKVGNPHLVGVEAESCGVADDWTAAQRENYPRGVAVLLHRLGLPASRAIGHKEWAPRRKIDPAFWDLDDFRAHVARWMQEDSMPSLDEVRKVVREEVAKQLGLVAKREDVGFARNQILTALGVATPEQAPVKGGAPDVRIAALTDAICALTDVMRKLANKE